MRSPRPSVPSAVGCELRADPVALWWHLAEQMPPTSPDRCEAQAGLILLAAVAAQTADDPDVIAARLLGAIGWVNSEPRSNSPAARGAGAGITACGHSNGLAAAVTGCR